MKRIRKSWRKKIKALLIVFAITVVGILCFINSDRGITERDLPAQNSLLSLGGNKKEYLATLPDNIRELYEKNLRIPCIDTLKNPASKEEREAFTEELNKCLQIASTLHIPFVRIKATDTGASFEEQKAEVISVLSDIIPEAEKNNVTIIIETSGIFSDTTKLLEVLNTFSCDSLAALWDFYSPYFIAGEEPETTIKNLGAYVKHVHLRDSDDEETYIRQVYTFSPDGNLHLYKAEKFAWQ